MKTPALILTMFLTFTWEQPDNDPVKSLTDAVTAIEENQLQEALTLIDQARDLVERKYTSELANKLLPKQFGDFKELSEDSKDYLRYEDGILRIERRYSKHNENLSDQPNSDLFLSGNAETATALKIAISNETSLLKQVAQAHTSGLSIASDPANIHPEMMELVEGKNTPLKIKDYRALMNYNESMSRGRLAIIAGAAIVEIHFENVTKEDVIENANTIDLDRVVEVFGA